MKFGRLQNGLLRSQPETAPSNFISNPTPLKDTTGWSLYSDAAGTAPVDGTGGSVNTGTEINWSRTTSSPLSETASFLFSKIATSSMQGKGVSYDFTVNHGDKSKVCRIDFDYEVVSGTYADGDLTVWLYDVTNGGAPIQPSASSILNAVGPQKKQPLSFQTNSNSTSYRLIIHVASTSASAYTVKFDNVSVTRESISQGTVVTDWVSYTPTLTNGTNVSVTKVSWRRVGDSVEILGYLSVTGAGSGADLAVSMPSGIVMDTGKINGSANNHVLGSGEWLDNGTGRFVLMPVYASTTVFSFQKQQIGGLQGSDLASGDAISFTIRVPILGWSSSQQLSSDADTRVVSFKATKTSSQAVSAGVSTVVALQNTAHDTHGGFSSNQYTCKVPGRYMFCFSVYASLATAPTYSETWLRKNGSSSYLFGVTTSTDLTTGKTYQFTNTVEIDMVAGDYVELMVTPATNGYTVGSGSTADYTYLSGYLIQGPAQIAASEKIAFRASNTAGTSLTGGAGFTDIPFATESFDTHGAFSTPTFTAPAPGLYEFNFNLYTNSVSMTTSQGFTGRYVVTGKSSGNYDGYVAWGNGASIQLRVGSPLLLDMNAGDTVKVQAATDATVALNVSSGRNYFQAKRIS